jgi:hypothetical protein
MTGTTRWPNKRSSCQTGLPNARVDVSTKMGPSGDVNHIITPVDCRVSGCQSGTCDTSTGQCECEPGHFWYDCSLGCSGVQVLSANTSFITDGGDNRPSTGFNVSCGWLITPPEPFDNITVTFDTFEVSENAPLSKSHEKSCFNSTRI